MTLTTAHLLASRIIANRHTPTPPNHLTPRTKQDIRALAEWDRAVAAWACVAALEKRVRDEEEGRRT